MREWWQHIPEYIDPIVFTVGFVSVHWYALCFVAGFLFALVCAQYYKQEFRITLSRDEMTDLFLVLFLGAVFGGHMGYGLLYRPDIFLAHPLLFFLPYQPTTGVWGIAGMSFHGGVIGVVCALFLFARRRALSFFLLADLIAFVAPLALFFGRIGNFLAVELHGRITLSPWGMYFPGISGGLRHPSSLYEACGEGIVLFFFLSLLRRRMSVPGQLAGWFLVGYGIIRFGLEYVREPDSGVALLWIFARGQVLSLALIVFGGIFLWWLRRKNYGKMKACC